MRIFNFLIIFTLLSLSPYVANASVDFHLLKSSTSNSSILVSEGGVLENGSKIRGVINIDRKVTLTVKFSSSKGDSVTLINNQKISSPTTIKIPSENGWYDLDNNQGKIGFTIILETQDGGKEINQYFYKQVSSTVTTIGMKLSSLENIGQKYLPIDKENSTRIPVKGTLPIWLDNSLEIASKLQPDINLEVRGAVGAKLYKKFANSVVLVATEDGIGTGSIIDEKGSILTNWHVVEGYETVAVIFKPPLGIELEKADVYKADVLKIDQITDLALLKISDPPSNLSPIPLGSLEDIEIGADAHAIGHPTGESWTYTQGIISQVRPGYEWQTDGNLTHKAIVIQTQTPINPGNSGGPLFSDSYKMIGVNSFTKAQSQGLNYAVSVKDVKDFLNSQQSRIVQKKNSECEIRAEPVDHPDLKGQKVMAVDVDCDDEAEMFIVDENSDGIDDYAVLDLDEDGYWETRIVSSENNGELNVWLIDQDKDGKADIAGIDDNLDGEPDRFEKL